MDLLCGGNATWSWSLADDCHVDTVNVVASCALVYASLVAVAYLKCSYRHRDVGAARLLPLHSWRALAQLFLLLALLAELADGALGYVRGPRSALHVLAAPCSALLAWCAALWWLRAAELQARAAALAASALLWGLCAAARLLRLSRLAAVGPRHVRPWAAAASAAAFAALCLVDLCAATCCRPHSKKVPSELNRKAVDNAQTVTYRHSMATFFSRVTFYWLTSLLRTGYSTPLEIEDLGQLPSEETAKEQFEKFRSIYDKENAAAEKERRHVSLWRCYFRSCWVLFTLGGVLKLLGDFVGFVGPLGISVIIDYVAELQDPAAALQLSTTVYYPTWEDLYCNGYVMGIVVFLSALAQGTFSQSSTHLVNVEGIHIKGALQALVYSKALRLCVWNIADHKDDHALGSEVGGSESANEKTNGGCETKKSKGTDVGAITNLMSEDVFNVMSFFWIGHYVWAIPLKIGVLMYLLHLKLGWSAIIGAAFCILMMTPLQFLIGRNMSSNSKAITDFSDERLRKMNEVLQGIKLLKLYGWECIFSRKIMETRQQELKLLDKDSLFWALLTFLTHASSVLVTLVTFGVYFKMVGGAMSPGAVFAGLALFNQLTVPLFIFPITVPVVISAMVSTRRLEDFLSLPETTGGTTSTDMYLSGSAQMNCKSVDASHQKLEAGIDKIVELNHSQDDSVFGLGNILEGEEDPESEDFEEEFGSKVVVHVNNASFSWSGDGEKVSLSAENITLLKGKLTLIVGRVGSGKSSLLSAVLGEMHMITGKVKWAEGTSVAYVAQKPWLLNGTLRDNILFGQKYRPRRYKRIISACALQPDIDILPGKDYTEIGEKGINLSGGQKQRIAIARALYSEADVVILDDPLSALDYQVGQQVFEQGIKRFLLRQKRTVILVTHSLQLLPFAHKIVVMEGGNVHAQGTLSELELSDRQLVEDWKCAMSREALEAQCCTPGRTAKERWRLVKLVSRIGLQLKQRNVVDGTWQTEEEAHVTPPVFTPLRKRVGTCFGSRYLAHDLPLPIDECEGDFVERNGWYRSSLRRHRAATTTGNYGQHKTVLRASSLQTGRNESLPYPVVRQFSSPSIHHDKLPGTINRSRTYAADIPNHGSLLRKIFSPSQSRRNLSSAPEMSGSIRERNILKRLMLSYSDKSNLSEESEKMPVKRLLSSASAVSDETNDDDDLYEEAFDLSDGRLMSEEEREYGKISKLIYFEYLCACGVVAGLTYIISAVVWQGLRVYTDYWLSQWTNSNNVGNEQIKYYLTIYAALSVASILLSLSSNGIGQYAGAKARRVLHDKMLCNILYCPMKFFESTPVGRVINRFSTDMGVIDKKLATSIQRLLQFLLLCFSAIFVNAVVTPWFLLIAVLVCIVYYAVQHFYRCSSRELQRLDSITRSPIFSHFSETLTGLTTIRAFGHQQRFMDFLLRKMDVHTNAFLIMNTANRWLGIALDYLGGVIVFVAILTALITASVYPGLVTPALVGLAINYTLLIPIYLNWVVKFLADMEMYMGAVERVQQYAKTPTEDYRREGIIVSQSWPEKGDILFENVSLRYDKNREPVITNLNLHISAGQKVGICGRTGCGKSSLVMSLFNMVEVYEGSIKIDGVDISKVPLQLLRSRLSIIPQDVIMFSGTIRDNLDPNHQYPDHELWRCLELSQLAEVVRSYPGGLDGEVREGGENLSVGERQLFCLARAILHNAACLVMDEATSSVDPGTERALMAAAAKAFSTRTVINIAHRLPTILDCDRIIVLDGGKVVEDGTPTELLHRPLSILTSMLRASEDTTTR